MVRSMWLFKHKFHADGTLSHFKARLVANGSSQQLGVDFDETFSPVVKLATTRKVLCLAMSRKWTIHQLDVKNAFLNGYLPETIYMHQPPGFVDARFPNHGYQVAHLLLYVDDIILMTSSTALLQYLIKSLLHEFNMTGLGELNYFLGISDVRHSTGTRDTEVINYNRFGDQKENIMQQILKVSSNMKAGVTALGFGFVLKGMCKLSGTSCYWACEILID
ncbi:ribonuclease H-like domain-containing protein [Tanacetum coccineum]